MVGCGRVLRIHVTDKCRGVAVVVNQLIQVRSEGVNESIMLLRAILSKQDEQNSLLKVLVQKQHEQTRNTSAWKNNHPALAQRCQRAAEKGQRLMDQMVENLVKAIEELDEVFDDYQTPFQVSELIDKYGYKFQQFSMMIHTLGQLGK